MSQTIVLPEPIAAPAVSSPIDANPQQVLFQAGLAYIVSTCLNVAVRLRIPELIGFGSKSVAQLALEAGTDEDYLYRVLRVLEMNQIVVRTAPRHYALSPAGVLLRREAEGSLAACIEWIADPLHLSLYSELRESVEEGETTFDRVYGEPFFQWLSRAENRLEAAVFNNAMTSISQMCIPAFLEAYSFEPYTCVVDVGGGHGALLRSILQKHHGLRGVVAEMPAVVENARRAIAADGLADRCEAVECDFFAGVPTGGDCYLMKHIVHDWADAQAKTLLDNIRAVIPADGRLILAEAVIDDSPAPHPGKLLDIEMMAFVGGRERTEDEFRKLLAGSGFTLRRVIHTRSLLALLEAVPA
ncbi:MAG TPA: methyltransferase [Terracidiphilus sp.]